MVATRTSGAEKALKAFTDAFGRVERREPSWLGGLRRDAMARLQAQGLPSQQDEDWRFTPLVPLWKLPLGRVAGTAPVAAEAVDRLMFSGVGGIRLVFVDGHYSPGLSRLSGLPRGARIANLASLLGEDAASLEHVLSGPVASEANPFGLLNVAQFTDGALVEVEDGVEVEEPVHLQFVSTGAAVSSQVRNVLRVGRKSRVTVIESYASLGEAAAFTNAATEVVAGDGAVLEHVRFQDENASAVHLGAVNGVFGAASQVRLHSFSLGGRLFRNSIRTQLAGPSLECILNGLYLTRGEQLADHHMVVEHAEPHCASHEYFNGILDDKSRGVFHGRILVRPAAQKTDAKQTNKNLLLSDDAQVNTKPQLEIYADDVKCTHGATVGQLDDDSIFYLRARGIGLDRARRMLIHSFAGEIIGRVVCEPAREQLDRLVWDRLEESPEVAVSAA